MSYGDPWGTPFYSGGGGSPDVPGRFPVAIAGRAYAIDEKEGITEGDLPVQRAQADTQEEPGEGTLSTDGLWRRTVETFHHGAGQVHYDRREADPARFRSSKGLDPWTKYRLSLLPDVDNTTAGTAVIALAVANNRLYALSTSAPFLRYTTDGSTWTTVTGLPATAPLSMATDGFHVWTAHQAAGIYQHDANTSTASSYAAGTVSRVGYVRGRLMASSLNLLYNVTSAALPAPLYTHPNSAFRWQGFAEGPGQIYAFGSAASTGDRALVYRTAIKPDGTALDIPVVAARIPPGEFVYAMGEEQGLGVLGLSTGWKPFLIADDGDLILGSTVQTDNEVQALAFQGRFVWFGWTNYDGVSTGLGRIDMSTDTAAGTSRDGSVPVPAYASDLMATGQGQVLAVAEWFGRRVFAVSGLGVFIEADDGSKVASGVIDLGLIGWGIGDAKNALYADVRHLPLVSGDSVALEASKDGGAFATVGDSSAAGTVSATIQLGQLLAETVGARLTLTGDPTLTMATFRAAPAPSIGELVRLPLKLFRRVEDHLGAPHVFDVAAERRHLRALRQARTAVAVQLGSESFVGIIDRLEQFVTESMAYDDDGTWLGWWNGVQWLVIKRVG